MRIYRQSNVVIPRLTQFIYIYVGMSIAVCRYARIFIHRYIVINVVSN